MTCLFTVLIANGPLMAAEAGVRIIRGTRELPERGVFPEYVMITPGSRISVLAPMNSLAEPDPEARKLKFQLPGYAGTIVLEVVTNYLGPVTLDNQPELLQLLQNRFPNATIRPLGVAHAGSDRGLTFDIERVTQYNTRLITRLAFISIPDGMLEASLTASHYSFPSVERTFTTFLGCVQIREAPPNRQTLEHLPNDTTPPDMGVR